MSGIPMVVGIALGLIVAGACSFISLCSRASCLRVDVVAARVPLSRPGRRCCRFVTHLSLRSSLHRTQS